jgi:hypothetical protein
VSHPRETKLESAISSFWKVLLPSHAPKKIESDIDAVGNSSARKSMVAVTVDNLGGTKICQSVNQAGYRSYSQQPSNSSNFSGPVQWISHLVPLVGV